MKHIDPNALIETLLSDVSRANHDRRQADDAYARRTVVRTIFAALEGLTAFLKWNALERAQREPGLYSVAEVSLLREESYGLGKQGDCTVQERFLPTLENLLFSYRMCTRDLAAPAFNTQGSQWSQLAIAIRVRNRITHPRSLSDLTVSKAEVTRARLAFLWVSATCMAGLVALRKKLSEAPPAHAPTA